MTQASTSVGSPKTVTLPNGEQITVGTVKHRNSGSYADFGADGTKLYTPSANADRQVYRNKCGSIDVHKNILYCCACITDSDTGQPQFFTKMFSAQHNDLEKISVWFRRFDISEIIMESTGKYWIPPFDFLEMHGFKPAITHPKYVKAIKGHKTDFQDCIHMCTFFRTDAIKTSFIPPAEIRNLRELMRYRLKLTYIATAEKNRYQNTMTVSSIRLDTVLKDPFGVTATKIMEYITSVPEEDYDEEHVKTLIDPRVKATPEEVLDSIRGYHLDCNQREKLDIIGEHLADVNKAISKIDSVLSSSEEKYAEEIKLLTSIPGIQKTAAFYILGEIGTNMDVWVNVDELISWAGLCPACNESANRRKSTRIGKGGHYLKPLLVQCALAAKKNKKEPYFAHKYNGIASRRGHKKAIIAVARMMLVCIYHILKDKKPFQPNDFDQVCNNTNDNTQVELNIESVCAYLKDQGLSQDILDTIRNCCGQGVVDQVEKTTSDKQNGTPNTKNNKKTVHKAKTSQKEQKANAKPSSGNDSGKPLRQKLDEILAS